MHTVAEELQPRTASDSLGRNAVVFASRLEADLWSDQIRTELGINCRAYLSIRDGLGELSSKADFFIVQADMPTIFEANRDLPNIDVSLRGSIYVVDHLRWPKCPNANTPVIYTAKGKKERLEEIKNLFRDYAETYFFHELSPDGIIPFINKIMSQSKYSP